LLTARVVSRIVEATRWSTTVSRWRAARPCGPTGQHGHDEEALRAWPTPGLPDQLELEAKLPQNLTKTTDAAEGSRLS